MKRNKPLGVFAAILLVTGSIGLIAVASGGAAPSPVRLHLGSNGRYFQFGSTTQTLTTSNNSEVLVGWLSLSASAGYPPAIPRIEEVLGRVGRMKYLRPLYEALAQTPQTRARARACFNRFKAGYHPIARQVVEGVLSRAGA